MTRRLDAPLTTAPPISSGYRRGLLTAAVIIGAVGGGYAFAWLNSRYATWVQDALTLDSALAQGLAFSAFPLAIGLSISLINPTLFGLRLSGTFGRIGRIVGVTVGLCAIAAVALLSIGDNPFRGANPLIQAVAVPVSEELVFRGVLFGLVLLALGRLYPMETALPLTVVVSAVAFGMAHLNNIGSYDTVFVVMQSAYAMILGLGVGYLRGTTGSVFPAMAAHSAVNIVALLV
jgi:membrane protease YdiL (CAAX protease family)